MNKKSTQTTAPAQKHPYASPQVKLVDINFPAGMLTTSGKTEDEDSNEIEVERTTSAPWI